MRSDELLAQVMQHPEDVALCRVWADSMIEEGNPRGEFVALQLAQEAGRLDDAGAQRLAVLQKAHQKVWLGDLSEWAASATFERGRAVEVWLTALDNEAVARIATSGIDRIGLPRDVEVSPVAFSVLLELKLRALKGVSAPLLAELVRVPRPSVAELDVEGATLNEVSLERLEQALPSLRRLTVHSGPVFLTHLLWSSALSRRLEQLAIDLRSFAVSWRGAARFPAPVARWSTVRVEVSADEPPLLRIEAELRAGPVPETIEIFPARLRDTFSALARGWGAQLA